MRSRKEKKKKKRGCNCRFKSLDSKSIIFFLFPILFSSILPFYFNFINFFSPRLGSVVSKNKKHKQNKTIAFCQQARKSSFVFCFLCFLFLFSNFYFHNIFLCVFVPPFLGLTSLSGKENQEKKSIGLERARRGAIGRII